MQDSVDTAGYTDGADVYAGYLPPGYNNYASMAARFPGKIHVSIATRFTTNADVLDWEDGTTGTDGNDASLAVQWVQRQRSFGQIPTIYVQLSLWAVLRAAFRAAGVVEPGWWIAHWTDVAHLEPGSQATQWRSEPAVDLSVVADWWPTIDGPVAPSGGGTPIPAPIPVPIPLPIPEDDPMWKDAALFKIGDGPAVGSQWLLLPDGRYYGVQDGTEYNVYVALGAVAPTGDANGANLTGAGHRQFLASSPNYPFNNMADPNTPMPAAKTAAATDNVSLNATAVAIGQ